MFNRSLALLALAASSCLAFGQYEFIPKALSYSQTTEGGGTKVIWKVEPLHDVTSVPKEWVELDSLWAALKDNPHFEREYGGTIYGDIVVYNNAKERFLAPNMSVDVSNWYQRLANLNSKTFDLNTEIIKYNESNDRYKQDLANYNATTVTQENKASIDAWYQRLLAEYNRLNDWSNRIDGMQAGLLPLAKTLNDDSAVITARLKQSGEDLYQLYVKIIGRVRNETAIAEANEKLAAARAKVQKNNEALRNLMKVTVTVQEAEDWAKLAESEREKGQWDAILSLASVALSEAGRQSTAAQAMTRAELRTVKQTLMYKYKLKPEEVKKILKNWVDDGKSVLTIKTRAELFEQLGGLVTLADAADKSTRAEYLEALASCLGVFVKTPALNLLVTNIQIYMSLFNTGFTYYHANERVTQLLKLSEDEIRGVESIAKLTKKVVDEEIVPLKKQIDELRSKRTYG